MLVNVIPSICLASVFMLPLLGKKFIHPLMSFFCLFFNVNIVKWPPRRSSSDSQTFIYNPSFWKHSLSSLPFCWCWGRVVWVALQVRQKEEICIGTEAALCLGEQWSCQSLSGCESVSSTSFGDWKTFGSQKCLAAGQKNLRAQKYQTGISSLFLPSSLIGKGTGIK